MTTTHVLVGSTAAKFHFPSWREPKDKDVFTPMTDPREDAFWHPSLALYWPGGRWIATPDELYTIKLSHSYWELENGSWLKHITDAMLLKREGAKLISELHKLLYRIWEGKHGVKKVDLDMDKASFFDDAVPRKYDHDSVHYSVAYGAAPMYEKVLKNGAEVGVSMAKIKALPFEDCVKLFREEIYATALERKMIPSDYRGSPGAAYQWALRRTITSLTKGWSATFIVDNYELFRKPDIDYVGHHKSKSDQLIPYERKNK